ncbi:MAG: DUF3048 domain-containing protein [bacterium]|nr:DUF3048 domain-containing protein [bacterium]
MLTLALLATAGASAYFYLTKVALPSPIAQSPPLNNGHPVIIEPVKPFTPEPAPVTPVEPAPIPKDPAPVSTTKLAGAIVASIDNYVSARPQSGLDKADLVVEMIAEGGITRFLAFFYSKPAPLLGPIRSARYYFVQIVKPFNVPFAHAGGAQQALDLIKELKVPDICEIYNSSAAFWRDTSRAAPSNLYTSTTRLINEVHKKGLSLSILPKLPFGIMTDGKKASKITLTYSPSYNTSWTLENNRYLRYINGKPHTMKDGAKLYADTIVVLAAPHRNVYEGTLLRTDIDIIGSGAARFFRDGFWWEGTWEKKSAITHFEFLVDGQTFQFNEGITWIQVLPSLNSLTVTN